MSNYPDILSDTELQNWEQRIRENPKQTLFELKHLIGTTPTCGGLDDEYWNGLQEHTTSIELAQHVLMRLSFDSKHLLEKIAPNRKRILKQTFRRLANTLRQPLEVSEEEWADTKHHPVLYPELVFEGQEYYWEAAATYALEHDQLDTNYELQVFTEAMLRFKLAHVLRLLDTPEPSAEQCLTLAESAFPLLQKITNKDLIPAEAKHQLHFHVFEWLAPEYGHNNQLSKARDAYLKAAFYAPDIDLKIGNIVMAASTMADMGEKQKALRKLEEHCDEARQVSDPEVQEMWETKLHWLRHELGAKHRPLPNNLKSDLAKGFTESLSSWLVHEQAPDDETIQRFLTFLDDARQELSQQDIEGQYGLILGLLRIVDPAHRQEEWLTLMDEAITLESQVKNTALHIDRQLLLARYEARSDSDKAVQTFAALWNAANHQLHAEKKLGYFSAYLECLSKSFKLQHLKTITLLIRATLEQIQALFSAQPTSSARKRIREVQQGPIENALATALTLSEHPLLERSQQQTLLKLAWQVFLTTRNPELTIKPDAVQTPVEQTLTDNFENAYSDHLNGSGDAETWELALEQLLDHELINVYAPAQFLTTEYQLPKIGLSLGFFQFREISKHIMVMTHQDGKYSASLISNVPELMRVLKVWQYYLMKGDTEKLPDLLLQGLIEAQNNLFANSLEKKDSVTLQAPWSLFLDGDLNSFPIEMLPITHSSKPLACLQGIQHKLRPETAISDNKLNNTLIDWQQGWLGLADVPGTSNFSSLPGTRHEVENIQKLLQEHQYPTKTLLSVEAHRNNLIGNLKTNQPSALHLAVHGIANQQYPEACALLLSPSESRSSDELLLFRHIQQLNLRKVQLVVLSACSSSVGPTTRSAGLEGLVWAFLQAGARQVIASRYSVNDHDTAVFMQAFYQHLVNGKQVIEALQKTKLDCLLAGMSPKEISAWSVWS